MTINRQIELLKIERECVQRNHDGRCDRDCANCELVQTDTELMEMYDEVIRNYEMAMEKTTEKEEPKTSVSKGNSLYDTPYDMDYFYWH